MKAKSLLLFVVLVSFFGSFCCADTRSDGCTTITVGRLASADGSVITSHTCDSHGGHTWLVTVPAKEHKPGSLCPIYKNTESWDSLDTPKKELAGHIPQVAKTYGYLYGFYGIINEHQLAIGESTFDGRKELVSKKGLLNCYELSRLIAERCRTAREAITLIDELTQKYGYNDLGECLTLADKKEVWHLEIVGGRAKISWEQYGPPFVFPMIISESAPILAASVDSKRFLMNGAPRQMYARSRSKTAGGIRIMASPSAFAMPIIQKDGSSSPVPDANGEFFHCWRQG